MPEYTINDGINVINQLVRTYNLQNVRVPDARKNDYTAEKVQMGYVTPDEVRAAKMAGMGGIPVFVDLILTGASGDPKITDTYIDNITGKLIEIPTIRFEAVICTVDFAMNIVKTAIQGRNGTVKEYIGQDDAKIAIQGVICGTNGVYPQQDVKALLDWINAPVDKGAVCGYLQNLGITNLVVESANMPQVVGGYSYQTFTINCISNLPVELLIQ